MLPRQLVLCLAALAAAACTDVGLVSIKADDDKLSLEGEVCTGAPSTTVSGLRVLFLTDSSASMRFNDPNDLLVDAIEHVTAKYLSAPDVGFAVIRWGSVRTVRENVDYAPAGTDPPLFTNDRSVLQAIFQRMRDPANPLKYLDGTDYELALRSATDYIVADLAKHPGQSLTTRYVVDFVTDGIPQSSTNDPQETRRAIIAATKNLQERYGARVDVAAIALTMVIPPDFIGLLPEMARVGGGVYTQLATPEGLDGAFDKALANRTLLVEYQLDNYFVFNRNLRLTSMDSVVAARVDSDGDGLVDEYEVRLGTDLSNPDTDGDGLSDLFEAMLWGEFDPLSYNTGHRGQGGNADADSDSLTTFEETRLGLDPSNPDTDGDGAPDGIELVFGTDPQQNDARSDGDSDGVPAGVEVRENTSPLVAEDRGMRQAIAYRVKPAEQPIRSADGIRCYVIRVDNVALAPTEPGPDRIGRQRPRGLNALELIAVERPIVDSSAPVAGRLLPNRQSRAARWVVLGAEGYRDPQAFTLHVRPEDFER